MGQQQQQQNTWDPFMQQQQQTQAPPLNTNFASNPYNQQLATPQSMYQSPMEQSPAQQYGAVFFNNGAMQPPQQMNPYLNKQSQQAPQQGNDQQPQYQQQRQQTYPQMPQQTLRADKRSIMDLYNYPQLAPAVPQQVQQPQQNQLQMQSSSDMQSSEPQRSVSGPATAHAAGTNNPFASSSGTAPSSGVDTLGQMGQFAPKSNGSRHVSQESVDAGGWANGRHSPDAWGSISARSMR